MYPISKDIAVRILAEAGGPIEEDVRVACERIFTEELPKIGIDYLPAYEVQISSGRVDALYNSLCIEYKRPGLVASDFDAIVNDKIKYIQSLADHYRCEPDQIVCVLLDGQSIGFFRRTSDGVLRTNGPFPINENSIEQFILYAKSTTRKALIPDNILKSFDHDSAVTKKLIAEFWYALTHSSKKRTTMFFHEWGRLFGQVTGNIRDDSIIGEARAFGIVIHSTEDAKRFVFVLHSVYALIIKHIALMILSARKLGINETYTDRLSRGSVSLQTLSREIEDGAQFTRLGIRNFLEGDYFCWYVSEWTGGIENAIQHLLRELSLFEPQTGTLKPEAVRDLMKQLYEGLISKTMRHSLGEYYTPDWMAEYVLRESGFHSGMKILDPTCGSGTFLICAISKMMEQPSCSLSSILSHVYGFDLNPLAVISARTNYIIAIEPLLDEIRDGIEIPVFLGDAIFSPSVQGNKCTYYLDTDEGRLQLTVPEDILSTPGLLSETLSRIENLANLIWSRKTLTLEQAERILDQFLSERGCSDHAPVLDLLRSIDKLESHDWDGIWCGIIKNYFSTAQAPMFDVIVGNPPWVRWSKLPENYRNTIKDFCKAYDLFSSDKFVGGVESDISTMVLYSAADKWLRQGGTLAMLITRTVFKTESSEGFRKFRIPNTGVYMKVSKIEDFTLLRPFEDAVNKPALIVLKKGVDETAYPLSWIVWSKKSRIHVTDSLPCVLDKTSTDQKAAYPIGGPGSPWLTVPEDRLKSCLSLTRADVNSEKYVARKGICTDMNGVYYGTVSQSGIFTNSFGTNGSTKNLTPISSRIEDALLYPVARGKEISPFTWKWAGGYALIPQKGMHGFPVEEMAKKYPFAFDYLSEQKHLLVKRSSLRRYLKNDPFYSCWNVGAYSFAPYKVCWREISSRLQSCVLTSMNGKCVVPDHKIYFVATNDEAEAYYLCSVLNASPVNEIVMNYAENTQIGTHIFDYVLIPHFNAENAIHLRLSELGRQAHNGTKAIQETIEVIDNIVTKNPTLSD